MISKIDPEPQRDPEDKGVPPKILIAEDDECQLEILEYRFKQQGFNVLRAESGAQAVQVAKDERPDAIIMDIELPDSSGIEVCKSLTDDQQTGDIPVVILSGSTDDDVVRQTRSAGSSFFLRKPFDPSALLIIVNRAIEDSRAWI